MCMLCSECDCFVRYTFVITRTQSRTKKKNFVVWVEKYNNLFDMPNIDWNKARFLLLMHTSRVYVWLPLTESLYSINFVLLLRIYIDIDNADKCWSLLASSWIYYVFNDDRAYSKSSTKQFFLTIKIDLFLLKWDV